MVVDSISITGGLGLLASFCYSFVLLNGYSSFYGNSYHFVYTKMTFYVCEVIDRYQNLAKLLSKGVAIKSQTEVIIKQKELGHICHDSCRNKPVSYWHQHN